METYSPYMQAKPIKRGGGRSARGQRSVVASAAYRSGEDLEDRALNETFRYARRTGVEATKIVAPTGAPDWVMDRTELWNMVELHEKRADAQLAREITLHIPFQIPLDISSQMIWDYCAHNFARHGMVADAAIHRPGKGDQRNNHVHILVTMRDLTSEGFGLKNRTWNANEMLESWRADWERICNEALTDLNSDIRFDRRSILDQRTEKLEQADAAADWTERRRLKIEAARLNYLPRPHLPQTLFRLMVAGGPISDDDQLAVDKWEAARISKAAAYALAAEMEIQLEQDILADAQDDEPGTTASPHPPAPDELPEIVTDLEDLPDDSAMNPADAEQDAAGPENALEALPTPRDEAGTESGPERPLDAPERDQAALDASTLRKALERVARRREDDRIAWQEAEARGMTTKVQEAARRRADLVQDFEDRWMEAVEHMPTPARPSKAVQPFFRPYGFDERVQQGLLNRKANLFSARGMQEVAGWERLKLRAMEVQQIMRKALSRWVDRIIADLPSVISTARSVWQMLVGENQTAVETLKDSLEDHPDLRTSLEIAVSNARSDQQTFRDEDVTDRGPEKCAEDPAKAVGGTEDNSQKLAAADEPAQAPDGSSKAHSASDTAQQAAEAEKALSEARDCQSVAERNLAQAKRDLKTAQEILDGRRELFTEKLVATGKPYKLTGGSWTGMTDEEIAEQEYLDNFCDADGDEMIPHVQPAPAQYGETSDEQEMFTRHFAAWKMAEKSRLNRAEKNKRAIWKDEFPKKRQELREYHQMDATRITGERLEAVRSLFDWLRERVSAARQTLGEQHELTRRMASEWAEVLVENKMLYDAVLQGHQQVRADLDDQAAVIGEAEKKLRIDVEAKRDTYRNPHHGSSSDKNYE